MKKVLSMLLGDGCNGRLHWGMCGWPRSRAAVRAHAMKRSLCFAKMQALVYRKC